MLLGFTHPQWKIEGSLNISIYFVGQSCFEDFFWFGLNRFIWNFLFERKSYLLSISGKRIIRLPIILGDTNILVLLFPMSTLILPILVKTYWLLISL